MRNILTAIVVFNFGACFSQNDIHFNTWWTNNLKLGINEKWSVNNQLSIRRIDGVRDWQQFIERPNITYKHSGNFSYTLGYTYIHNWSYGLQTNPYDLPEHNIWEEVVISTKINKIVIKQRYREEHRFSAFEPNDGGYNYNFSNRFRYRFILGVPLIKNEKLKAEFFNEIFLLQGKGILPTEFNQNWTSVELKYSITPKLVVAVGYMYQFFLRGAYNELNHTITTVINYKF